MNYIYMWLQTNGKSKKKVYQINQRKLYIAEYEIFTELLHDIEPYKKPIWLVTNSKRKGIK